MLSCSVLSDSLQPHGLSLPGSLAMGFFQAGILKTVTISYSRGSSLPRDRTPESPAFPALQADFVNIREKDR